MFAVLPAGSSGAQVMLVDANNQTASAGRLMVYHSGLWGPVAAVSSLNVTPLATVACSQLGYTSGAATANSVYRPPAALGQWALSCATGREANLSVCTWGAVTGGYTEVEVACAVAGGERSRSAGMNLGMLLPMQGWQHQ